MVKGKDGRLEDAHISKGLVHPEDEAFRRKLERKEAYLNSMSDRQVGDPLRPREYPTHRLDAHVSKKLRLMGFEQPEFRLAGGR